MRTPALAEPTFEVSQGIAYHKDTMLPDPAQHAHTRALFLRAVGLVYLIAIASWWVQIDDLVGSGGLVPAAPWLKRVSESAEAQNLSRMANVPTVFWWIGASDTALHVTAAAGCALAVCLIAGFITGPCLVGLFLIYLSFVTTGSPFMNFQWDILLLEVGFLSIFLAPWRCLRLGWKSPPVPAPHHMAFLVLLWLVVAKLMFFSGWTKIAWAGEAHPEWWPEHTAMTYHYFTQPIPNPLSWYAHHLPLWFHKASLWPMFFVELVLPFLVFFGRRARLVAAVGFAGLMLLIAATGNYTYFNLLTIVLCIPLIAIPSRREQPETGATSTSRFLRFGPAASRVLPFALLLWLNIHIILRDLHNAPSPLLENDLCPDFADTWAQKLAPFQIASGYGLFRTMTTERPEIIFEGSADGNEWKTYDFRWKADSPDDKPSFIAPHQPRLAWQFWFAALERQYHPRSRNAGWFSPLVSAILDGKPVVDCFLVENPFPTTPPRYVRARLEHFTFTSPNERRATGQIWNTETVGQFLPTVSKTPASP